MSASLVLSIIPATLRTALTTLLLAIGIAHADVGQVTPVGRPLPAPVVPAAVPVASIAFSGDGAVNFDGNPHAVTATDSSGGTVEVTYDGSSTAPSAAGTYAVVGTVTDGPDAGFTASTTLVIVEMHVRQGAFGWGQDMWRTTQPSGVDLVAVAANERMWLGLTHTGKVVTWQNPYNDYGQQDVPSELDDKFVVAIAAGPDRAMAVCIDGTLRGWGNDGNGDISQLNAAGITDAKQVAIASNVTVVLHDDGSLTAAGYSADPILVNLPTATDFKAISGYRSYMLGLHTNGTVTSWGSDPADGGWSTGASVVPVGLSGVKAIAAGYNVNLALKSDGTVVKFGAALDGTPMPDLSNPATAHIVAISMGEINGAVLRDDGTVLEFGNTWTRPPEVNGQRITAVASGFHVTLVAAEPTIPAYDGMTHDISGDIIAEPAGLDVAVAYDGITAPALPKHAGSYGYTASVTLSGSTVSLSGTLNITKRPIEVDADNLYLHLGDPLPSPLTFTTDYSQLPLVSGDTFASAFTGELAVDPGNAAAGDYDITQGTLASADYDITFYSGTLYRRPENTTPTIDPSGPWNLVRGEDDGTYVYATYSDDDEEFFGQTVTVTWSVVSWPVGGEVTFSDPHTYYTTLTASVDGEYVLRMTVDDGIVAPYEDITMTMSSPVQLIFTDDTVTYDGSPHALTVTTAPAGYTVVQSFNNGDTTAASAINAGSYSVFGTLNEPYKVARGTPGTLIIGKAATTLSFASEPVFLPFSGQPQAVTATADAVPAITGTVMVTYDGVSTLPSEVGVYVLQASLDDVNWDATPVSGTLEITPTTAATVRLVPRMVIQTSQSGQPTPPEAAVDLVQVIPTTDNFMALTHDGHVVTWGANAPAVPEELSAGGVLSIANGLTYDLAVASDGSLVAWGENPNGVLDVPAGTYTQVAALGSFLNEAFALTTDGNVVSWGSSDVELPSEVTSGGHVVAIAAGSFHALALLDDGTVVGLGWAPVVTPPADLNDVAAISAGYQFSVALKHDGTVVAWGYPGNVPTVPDGLSDAVAVAAGTYHVAVLKQNGTVTGWGNGWHDDAPYATLAGLPGVTAISAGSDITVALTTAPTTIVYDGTAHVFPTPIVTDPAELAVLVTYNGALTPPTHAGTYVVKVMADPNAGYNSALSVSGMVISRRELDSITIDSHDIHVGDALPAITGSADGLVGSDTFNSLILPLLSHTATDSSTVGFYPINTSSLILSDYHLISFTNGGLHVYPANTAPEISGITDLLTATMGSRTELTASYDDVDAEVFGQDVTAAWTQVSGPGSAVITPDHGAARVTFDRDGIYVLRYTVDDGHVTVTGDQRVLVSLPGTLVADDSSYDEQAVCYLEGDWTSDGLTGIAGSETHLADDSASVEWSIVPEETGWYQLFYYQLNDQQPLTPYSGTVTHADGTTAVSYGGSKLATGWVSLGAFRSDHNGLDLQVVTAGVSGCSLRADAIRIIRLPGTLVDNGMDGYLEHGSGWADSTLVNRGVTCNPTRFSRSLSATATWSDPGLNGEARVLFYRLPLSTNDPEWKATLTAGDGDHHFVVDARSGALGWADLGRHLFSGSAEVTLGHETSQVLRADAVRFALDTVVQPGDLGYREAGGRWFDSGASGSAGQVRYSRYSTATVIYRASLAPGAYRVSWYRIPYPHDSPEVKLQVTGCTPSFSGTSDLGSGPSGWTPLGDFIFKTGVGQVQIKRSAFSVTPLRVDAVRFEPLGDAAPVGVVPDGGSG